MRKRLTQYFPFLIPIRVKQKIWCSNTKMFFDKNKYANQYGEVLKNLVCETKTIMINEESGQDIIYQKNKVYNLKLISKTMNEILIRPNETFSFWQLAKNYKQYGNYKDGLVLVDGKLTSAKGGGLCQLSNMLYFLFLHTDLTIIERVGHGEKSFPNPDKSAVDGTDATINQGWIDLKVKNNTDSTFQILIDFDDIYMYGMIKSDAPQPLYKIKNGTPIYKRENNQVYGYFDVIRMDENKKETLLYNEKIKMKYEIKEELMNEEN